MADFPTSVRLSADLKKALQTEAKKRRWPTADLLRYILEQWLIYAKKQGGKP